MRGKVTILSDKDFTLGTGNVLAAFRTAAAGSDAAHVSVVRVAAGQRGTTTLEMIGIELATRDTAGTLTMTASTPRVVSPIGGAASGLTGNTAPAGGDGRAGTDSSADSGGTYTTIFPDSFPNTAGWLWKPDPREEIWVPPSTVFVVRLLATPTGTTNWWVAVTLQENT